MFDLWYMGRTRFYVMPGGPYASRELAANAAGEFIKRHKLSGYAIMPVGEAPAGWPPATFNG